jgi:hypothetical protein
MTAKKMMIPPTWPEGENPMGLRIGESGELEWLTEEEADALVKRAFGEAMVEAGWRRKRILH